MICNLTLEVKKRNEESFLVHIVGPISKYLEAGFYKFENIIMFLGKEKVAPDILRKAVLGKPTISRHLAIFSYLLYPLSLQQITPMISFFRLSLSPLILIQV